MSVCRAIVSCACVGAQNQCKQQEEAVAAAARVHSRLAIRKGARDPAAQRELMQIPDPGCKKFNCMHSAFTHALHKQQQVVILAQIYGCFVIAGAANLNYIEAADPSPAEIYGSRALIVCAICARKWKAEAEIRALCFTRAFVIRWASWNWNFIGLVQAWKGFSLYRRFPCYALFNLVWNLRKVNLLKGLSLATGYRISIHDLIFIFFINLSLVNVKWTTHTKEAQCVLFFF